MKTINRILTCAIALLAIAVYAADISGNWKGTAEFGDRTIERSFTFKVDGKKLTGETSSEMMGKSVITEGVIDGDDVSFTITGTIQGNEMTLHYKGKVHGNEMTLSSDANGQNIEWKVKKSS